jgi:quercetin dioxygenase-like cupin family protein
MSDPTNSDERLRPHPEARFAPEQIEIDLNAIAARLRGESHTGERGHRQETLFHHDGLTIALFLFERFTHLAAHRARGVVNIHVLRGRLKITLDKQVHELVGGQMLLLAAGVEHAVAAEEESEMLLTVQLATSPPPKQ